MPKAIAVSPGNRIKYVTQAGADAANMLRGIGDAMNAPYIKAVAGVSLLIIEAVQIVKTNKEICITMTERVYQLVCAIINVYGDSEADLSPAMLRSIASLTDTLQKVLSFLRSQAGGNRMKRILRHLEDASLMEESKSGLQHALGLFNVQADMLAATTMAEFQAVEARRHKEILALIVAQQRDDSSVHSSWERQKESTSSISLLLPASPKIFHGREEQLQLVLSSFHHDQSFVAILGPGGVGKSSLALAALHHSNIIDKFGGQRYWVPCDSAKSVVDLAAAIAASLGLESQGRADKAVVQHLRTMSTTPVLLLLDNLETPWEPPRSRPSVEEYLSQLADLKHISIMITMRGAERPGKVRWSRPFIPPLRPLDSHAARETFLDISDVPHDDPSLDEVLALTDNLPLAVTLVASLAEYVGCSGVLERWKSENISLLSDGPDKRSSLEKSIIISLLSPRMVAAPDARELLSVLSVLPDGVTDAMLEQLSLPVREITKCKTTLIRTSLAYVDHEGRTKVLAPIREYVMKAHPPSSSSTHALRLYFFELIGLFESFEKSPVPGLVQRIASNLGNIRATIQYALSEKDHGVKDSLRCLFTLSRFTVLTDIGSFDLLKSVQELVESLGDDDIKGCYLLALSSVNENDIPVEALRIEAIRCFERTKDISSQARAHDQMSFFHLSSGNLQKAFEYAEVSYSLAKQARDYSRQSWALYRTSVVHYHHGEMRKALEDANEGRFAAQTAGDMYVVSMSLRQQAVYTMAMGQYHRAASLAQEASALLEALGLDHSSSMYREVLEVRAEIHRLKTEYTEARVIVQGLASVPRHPGQRWLWQATSLCELAGIDLASAYPDLSTVRKNLETAQDICIQSDYGFGLTLGDLVWAEYYCQTEDLDKAETLCYKSLASSRGIWAELTAKSFERLGDIAMLRNDTPSALRHYVSFLASTHKSEERLPRLRALQRVADVFLAQEDDSTSATLLELTLLDFTTMDIHQARGDCMFKLGGIWKRRNDLVKARECWSEARPLFQRSSQARSVELCDKNILLCR